jgi:uncharacterized protein YabN with tetrapyrrole methylase and pyrophosphatase domain
MTELAQQNPEQGSPAKRPVPTEATALDRAELVAVGTGYRAISDLTFEAREYIKAADKVLYLIDEPLTMGYVERLNPSAETLTGYYAQDKPRDVSYAEMADHMLREMRRNQLVCVVFYGHPGVFATPAHSAIAQARKEGFPARMLPAASAEDWLFADLGIDPATNGCQSFEAGDFLIRRRVHDPTSLLVLWQVGVIGMMDRHLTFDHRPGAEALAETLIPTYGAQHEVIVYVASPYIVRDPEITRLPLGELAAAELSAVSTLVVPPLPNRPPDNAMIRRLTSRS